MRKCRRRLEGSFPVLWVFCAWDGEARAWQIARVCVFMVGEWDKLSFLSSSGCSVSSKSNMTTPGGAL